MEGDFGPYLPGRVGSASIITPVKNGHTLSIWRPSLPHLSFPSLQKSIKFSFFFSPSLKRRWGAIGANGWNKTGLIDVTKNEGICNEDYLKTSEMERAENVPILIAKIALLSVARW